MSAFMDYSPNQKNRMSFRVLCQGQVSPCGTAAIHLLYVELGEALENTPSVSGYDALFTLHTTILVIYLWFRG